MWEINWIFMYNSGDIRIHFLHCSIWSQNYWHCQSHPHIRLTVKILYVYLNPANLTHSGSQAQKAEKYRQVSFYSYIPEKVKQTEHKLKTKFPFKTVYLLGISKLTISFCIAYYYTMCQRFIHLFQIGLLHLTSLQYWPPFANYSLDYNRWCRFTFLIHVVRNATAVQEETKSSAW